MRFSLFPGFVIFCLLLLQTGRSALVGCCHSAVYQAALSLRCSVCLLLLSCLLGALQPALGLGINATHSSICAGVCWPPHIGDTAAPCDVECCATAWLVSCVVAM